MVEKGFGADKTVYDNIDWCGFGTGANPVRVDIKDDRAIRVRPVDYAASYDLEEYNPWILEHNGKTFKMPTHSLTPPFSVAYKRHAFSRNRIPYPLIREDWDPEGDRHPETRGISKYKRISWDEACTIIAKEVKRQFDTYGAGSVLLQQDGHGETKIVHPCHGCMVGLLDLLGGYTQQARQPDSWEGWYWGAKHVWGTEPLGQGYVQNLMLDITENTDMLLYWGCDNETTPWGWAGQMASLLSFWFTEVGVQSVAIAPDLNYSAACHADKWIPVYPNTDLALQFGIVHTWLKEGLYDKEYLDTHAIGFDWLEYEVMGGRDGIEKTPKWAEERCGVPARTIKALARKWHKQATSTAHGNGGSYIRSCYSHEPARMEACMMGMQGLGKPGRNVMKFIEWNFYDNPDYSPMPRDEDYAGGHAGYNAAFLDAADRFIPKTLIPEGIKAQPGEPFSWYGHTICMMPREDQFLPFEFPRENEPGIHMIWSDTPCWSTCWNGGNEYLSSLRDENLEFMLLQHPWFENDAKYADLILPVSTRFEVDDIGFDNLGGILNGAYLCDQAVSPVGESKSDWIAVQEVAKKMEEMYGDDDPLYADLLNRYTKGRTVESSIEAAYNHSALAKYTTFDEFKEKGYAIIPKVVDWKSDPRGFELFCKDPVANPLPTPSGKLEFYSPSLAEHFPDDEERRPYPQYIADTERFHEYRESERSKDYPFLIVSNHPRWRVHANFDDNSWLREIETCKVIGPDGYAYEPVWINPEDAVELGVENGDVVKIYNERGWVLGGVYVTERILKGVVLQDHGARIDPIESGVSDRGGANNLIAPKETTSKNCAGEVTSGYLVGVEKVDVFELAAQNPAAFGRTFQADEGVDIENFLA